MMLSSAFLPSQSVTTNVNIHLLSLIPPSGLLGSFIKTLFHPLRSSIGVMGRAVKFSFSKSFSLSILIVWQYHFLREIALAVKFPSKIDIIGFAEVLFHSLEVKVNFYSLVYTNFGFA